MTDQVQLPPASEKLLRAISRNERFGGANVTYLSRGRYTLGSTGRAYNRNTFQPLFEHCLAEGWDEYGGGPIRLTDAGREWLATADATAKPKREKKPPNPESPSAIRALRALAALPQPVRPYGGARRGVWNLGSRDGHGVTERLVYGMEKAGYVRMIHGAHLSTLIEITDAGRARAAA